MTRYQARPMAVVARRATAKVVVDAVVATAILLSLMFGLPWALWAVSVALGAAS